MISFIVSGVVALVSIISLLGLSIRYRENNSVAWIGWFLILAAFLVGLTGESPALILISNIILGLGLVFYIVGIISIADKFIRKGSNRTADIQAKTISDILEVAASRESLIELLNYSLDRFLEVFSLNSGAIHIFHHSKDKLVMGAYRGLVPAHAKQLELLDPGQTAIGRAVQNKRVLIIRDLSVSPDYQFFGGRAEGYSFLAVAPILVDERCWGVISFLGRRKYHRGMFTIDQLEQFGYKLGQALVLGRENRRMTAAYNRLNNIIDFYNGLFRSLKTVLTNSEEFDDSAIFQMLQTSPTRLFDGKNFVLLRFGRSTGRCVYRQGIGQASETLGAMPGEDIPLTELPSVDQKGQYFILNESELSGIVPPGFYKNKLLTGHSYVFDDNYSGIVIIDDNNIEEMQKYDADFLLIGNLFTISYFWNRKIEESASLPGDLVEFADDLSTIFAGISGNAQFMLDRVEHGGETVNEDEYINRLNIIDKSTLHGLGILDKFSMKRDPNTVIQKIISERDLNVAFYPGPNLPDLKGSPDEFRETLEMIIKDAITAGNVFRMKTSPQNSSIALTIEGPVKSDFPSAEVADRAGLHNIIFNIIRGEDDMQEDTAHTSEDTALQEQIPRVLTVENKPVINDLLEDFFARIGYHNKTVTSGSEGLAFVHEAKDKNEPIDVAVIDMTLDDISGLELCREIKQVDSGIYTIIISSWGVNLHRHTLDDARVDAVLHKPFRLEQLKNVLPKRELTDAAEDR